MRLYTIGFIAVAVLAVAAPARAQANPFAGAWNITPEQPTTGVYWLDVKDEGGKTVVMFLNRGGSPVAAQDVKLSGNELSFMVGGTGQNRPTVTLHASGKTVSGTVGHDQGQPASVRLRGAPATPTRSTPSASRSCCSTASRWTHGACRTRTRR